MRLLPPWYENVGKRQVKAPKVYLGDTGLLHTLLGIETPGDLDAHPKVGASWEGFVVKELVTRLEARPEECYFWGKPTGAELDLLIVRGSVRRDFEIKRTTLPSTTRSMHAAREALGLPSIDLVHAGAHSFPLREGVRAVAFHRIAEEIEALP